MTISSDQLLDTIKHIYAAPLANDNWLGALNFISKLTGAVTSTYSGNYDDCRPYEPAFMLQDRYDPVAFREYREYYHAMCERGRYSRREPVGTVYFDYKYFSEREMDRSEYYAFLSRNGARYALGTTLAVPDSCPAHAGTQQCAIHFSERHGHPDQDIISTFERLVPHIMRANVIAQQLGTKQDLVQCLQSALDMSSRAILGLGRDFRVLFANRQAERLLAENDGVTVVEQRLSLLSAGRNQHFAEIAKAAEASTAGSQDPRSLMWAERPSGRRPYVLLVAPFFLPKQVSDDYTVKNVRYLVTITDLHVDAEIEAELLQELFDLTKAEVELAASLVRGRSPQV